MTCARIISTDEFEEQLHETMVPPVNCTGFHWFPIVFFSIQFLDKLLHLAVPGAMA